MPIETHNLQTSVTTRLPYRVYLPDDYDESKTWPLILFLHGAGERGSDFKAMESTGLAHKLASGDSIPFIVVSPQCPFRNFWEQYLEPLNTLLDTAIETYPVDTSRVYLTGLSMGGYGAWSLSTEYPERFAAVAPICGGPRHLMGYPNRLKKIKHIPVWTFHGDADEVVPISQTQTIVDALEKFGGNVKFTMYTGVKHDSWTQTYDNPALYDWFLQHQRA